LDRIQQELSVLPQTEKSHETSSSKNESNGDGVIPNGGDEIPIISGKEGEVVSPESCSTTSSNRSSSGRILRPMNKINIMNNERGDNKLHGSEDIQKDRSKNLHHKTASQGSNLARPDMNRNEDGEEQESVVSPKVIEESSDAPKESNDAEEKGTRSHESKSTTEEVDVSPTNSGKATQNHGRRKTRLSQLLAEKRQRRKNAKMKAKEKEGQTDNAGSQEHQISGTNDANHTTKANSASECKQNEKKQGVRDCNETAVNVENKRLCKDDVYQDDNDAQGFDKKENCECTACTIM